MTLTDSLGWLGTALVVFAYSANVAGLLGAQERAYQALNLAGAVLLGVSLFDARAWPAFGLQVVWGLVAIAGLWRGRA